MPRRKEVNPWAICHAQLGKKKTDKFERCVKQVKTNHGIEEGETTGGKGFKTGERMGSFMKKLGKLVSKEEDISGRRRTGEVGHFQKKKTQVYRIMQKMQRKGKVDMGDVVKGIRQGGKRRGRTGKREDPKVGSGVLGEKRGPSLAETVAYLAEKDWIQGAVNPKHKGFCTPMTKKTCTPRRKALAKRFKKAGRREGTRAGGKTGWKGKV